MNDALKITRYKDLEKHLTDLGYEIKSSSTRFQIFARNGALLGMPETIDGLYAGYCIIKTLHEQNLIK